MSFKQILSYTLATFIFFAASAQQKKDTYESLWRNVDTLIIKKGLTQSALTEVNKIYTRAKKENNDAQIVKALWYKMTLQEWKEEDAEKKNIEQIEKEILLAKEPARSILQSLAAAAYLEYFNNHRYQLYDRTATINFKKDDIATWGIIDFHKKIGALYLASVANEKLLQQTKLEIFDPIIIKGNMRHLRPALFDLLAHRALDYFESSERDITRPSYAFEIDNPVAFADAKEFAGYRFNTRDSLSLHFKALQLYQRLLQFHLNDPKPDALIDADISRLQFVNSNAIMENKEELYKNALQQVADKYSNLPAAAQAMYLLADWYAQKARNYNPLYSDTNRYAYVTAKEICEKVIAQGGESEGKTNCRNLLQQILHKSLSLQAELVNIPDQPFRLLVTYRNSPQVYFRLLKMDKNTRQSLGDNTYQDEYWKKLIQLPVIKSFSQTLPDTKDYQEHKVEIKSDALTPGSYALVAGTVNDFSMDKNVIAVQYFHVSNIAYIEKGNEYFVLHRETGSALARADVQVWYRTYDNNSHKYVERKGENIIADKNGYFKIFPAKTRTDVNYRLEISTPGDRLSLDSYNSNDYRTSDVPPVQETKNTFLFTDRSIYRPGQTVWFKGIVVNKNPSAKESSVAVNLSTTLYLLDVNGQKADSMRVTTNEYGTYSGKFTLPANLLNGQMSIFDKATNSYVYFSVEEYKRPKFMVEIDKPVGTYRLNDTIRVIGTAKAYAGNNIDGATVKYRVVRRTVMPLWENGWGRGYSKSIWPGRNRPQMEIVHGVTTTDANGVFTVAFKALPDYTASKKEKPTFYYEVSADVTDISGETRSGNISVQAAYQALQLNIQTLSKMHTDSVKKIIITSTNLNNIFEKSLVTVSVYKLKVPARLFRTRYWEQPDQFIYTQEEYYRLFPNDIYKNEDDPAEWAKEKVMEVTDTTTLSGIFTLPNAAFTAGWYAIEATTKDKYAEPVKDIKYTQLYNQEIITPFLYAEIESKKTVLEPGEKAVYEVNTNMDSVFMIHEIAKKDGTNERTFITLNKNTHLPELPVTENDRGGFAVQTVFVKHNRVYFSEEIFSVPYTNKQLAITYTTYRDKTLPGSEEKWKVKISGYKGEKVAAEMLTAMYDASLDQFQSHSWQKPDLLSYYQGKLWSGSDCFTHLGSQNKDYYDTGVPGLEKTYDYLGLQINVASGGFDWPSSSRAKHMKLSKSVADEALYERNMAQSAAPVTLQHDMNQNLADGALVPLDNNPAENGPVVQVRKNFNETAFFFPDLKTDSSGAIEFSFTIPEALTQWKWMTLAHTKDLAFVYSEKTIVTQKELMVQPNAPRFMREGDRMDFSGKIVNLTDKEITGQVQLLLIDPTTNQSVDGWFRNMFPNQFFTVAAGQSVPVSFTLEIPYQYNRPVTYRIVASSATLSDGEENILPVISNRMLVTESMPLPMRGTATKAFKFEKLLKSGSSETLSQHALTVEFTSNPAWYAVQALPYLMEYPYECAEQTFNRFYANTLAATIVNASPKIKEIFERWKTTDTAALLSNLQKNEELKSVLLQETPWVLQAKSESQQKKDIALLFDLVRMEQQQVSAINKLADMQGTGGGFVWFKGGPDDRYITQYILTGIGHLKKLNALPKNNDKLNKMIRISLAYLDQLIKKDYEALLKANKGIPPAQGGLDGTQIQYLYMRSFFPESGVPGDILKSYTYYRKQSQQLWLKQSKYFQGMIALSLYRTGDVQTAKNIVASLKQNAIVNEEMGMYWKDISSGYYWYQAPIESQSVLIETFTEVTNDTKSVDDMKTWLLKQKQTQNWRTTKATADACYALLLQGTAWLAETPEVNIKLGDYTVSSNEQKQEAGTGYFKKVIDGKDVKPAMGDIQVFIKTQNAQTAGRPSWGAVYWQYFENLDKITTAATPLQLSKKLFIEKNTDRGPVLQPVNEGDELKVGDKIKVRIELRSDRALEYVHMKDMRAACMEPVNVISQYKWQGGLGYYETTKDASTNFFFGWLPKGTFVFEYPMFVTHTGTFSNGVTTIQCMYAPEFTSHSEGVKVNVGN